MGLIGNFFSRIAAAGLTETAIAQALVAKSLTDSQARSTIGSASSVAAGLRAIGLTVVADTPAVTPTLTLTGPLAFTAGAAPGTLVANIGNVPAGVTPTLTPNDGRLAIAGDASSGWKVVVGLTASSAGTIVLSVAATGANGASADVTVVSAAARALTNNAVRLTGPGHSNGGGSGTSTGTTISVSGTYTNESKAPITVMSLAFIGWFLTTTGTGNVGNDIPVTATVEYPAGTVVGTFSSAGAATIVIPNGGQIETDRITLSSAIPTGAAGIVIKASCTIANGLKYPNSGMLGLAGVLSTTDAASAIAKVNLFAVGDSIATNNGAVFYAAAAGKCPCIQMSISGTTAQAYAAGSNFTKQMALAKLLGCTTLVGDFSTNDFGGSRTVEQVQADLLTLKAAAAAQGLATHWTTCTPRTNLPSVTATAASAVGNVMTLTVPDASKFSSVMGYIISGATPAGYNGNKVARTIDTVANTVTFDVPAGLSSPATGTIRITSAGAASTAQFQTSDALLFAGPSSNRGRLNAWIRSGIFDGYIDWADACEPSRDASRWRIAGETPYLSLPQEVTISSVVNTGRFICNYSRGGGSAVGGFIMCTSGANIGLTAGGANNNGGDFSTAPPSGGVGWAVGDTLTVVPLGCGTATDDGLHPRTVVNTFGGQYLIQVPTNTWLTAMVA